MECKMNYPEKQLKYSIRKVSVGAASVVIGALYLLMGAGIAHADGMESAREANRTANPADADQSGTGEPENTADLNNTDAVASTYNAPVAENPLVAPGNAKPRGKRALPDGDTSGTSNGATGTESGNNQPTGENPPVLDANRKGETVKDDQPGVHVPKDGETGSDDKNANLRFDDPGENATVEEMWKIIQNMPDDFQNNERSYLRNMDTLGNALRFDKTAENPEGVPLQPGEIREISSFGGWTAIMKKDGTTGKFAVGMKNKEGYFTGWYTDKDGKRQEGGMLGSDALDRVYVHEQALDRRFKYMLMLAKGRTIANKEDKAQDNSPFDIKTANRVGDQAELDKLPVKEKEDLLQHSPNIEGFNGIEKTFTAFSTKYGSRLKIDFVTGYISDYEGSKGTYRIVVKAIKKGATDDAPKVEETIYDHTINRIDGVVENEERYEQGVDLKAFNAGIKKLLKDEYNKKVVELAKERYKRDHPETRNPKISQYTYLKPIIEKELAEKGEAIVELPVDQDKLQEGTGKLKNKFKEELNLTTPYATVANNLNNNYKAKLDSEVQQTSPTWLTTTEKNPDGTVKSTDPDRVYKLLDFILPTAKKIIYHADTDQLELQTDPEKVTKHREKLKTRLAEKETLLNATTDEEQKIKLKKEISGLKSAIGSTNAYTYLEARNGSKEAKILGSRMEATEQPSTSILTEDEYNKIKTNELAAEAKDGLSKFTNYFVEKEKVKRSDVISDEELSKKITTAIDGDQDKLGKGGYFSTGDIPLDKDVVAYKIQVFAENEKRVGVNKQSPRLQYNLPILADFSVIQDTVEPSKEVAKRIIDKQVKEKKIPPEEGERLKGKIDESKKTSEVRKAISGNVKVRYVDEQGQDIPLSDEEAKKVGEKSDNGTYLVEKEALIGTSYNVTSKQLRGINTGEKKYRLKRSLNNGLFEGSAAVTGEVTSTDKIVTFVYEEGEATKAKAVVHVMKQQDGGTTVELPEHKLNLETEVGEEFPSEPVNNKVKELQKLGYEIIGNTFTNGTEEERKGDEVEDKDGEEPSQSYTITIKEKVETVTTPPTPNTPIDPTIPDGPKWPETGLKESDLKKEVTRTITYVKKETADGQEEPSGVEDKVDKVLFKRTATYNVVTKKITYGEWTATTDESHPASKLPAVDTPLKTGYVADIKQVEGQDAPKPTKTGEVTNINKKVVYTKLGSWVPKIPGKDSTPIPYPNDPDDPTKPKTPTYPENPETPGETPNPQPGDPGTPETPAKPPVIPYVPGYTPKVPTDPTQPENPDTNPLKPLEPLDPNDPKKGYKVPEIPNDPKKNKEIEYVPNPQKILIKVVNITTGKEVELPKERLEFSGVSDQVVGDENKTKVDNKIQDLRQRGYTVESANPITATSKYDRVDDATTGDPSQTYKILVKEPISIDTDSKTVTRTIKYVKKDLVDGVEVSSEAHATVTNTATFNREVKFNLVTGETTYGEWSEAQTLNKVASPVLTGYIADRAEVGEREVTATTEDIQEEVVYTKIGTWVPNLPSGETPIDPIPYPNHPTDPTKPGDPTPGVIPYVPGYTPKIGGTPLQPKVPGDPTKGYIPPSVPTEPGTDTEISYVPDSQRALVKVYNVKDGVKIPLENDTVGINDGKTDQAIPTKSLEDKIKELEKRGYTVDNKDLLKGKVFDNQKDPENGDPTQVYDLLVRERISLDTETKAVTRTIKYVKIEEQNGAEVEVENAQPTNTQTVNFSRDISINLATGRISNGKWSEKQILGEVKTPVLEGYLADKVKVESREVTGDSESFVEKVVYRKIGSWVPKVPGKDKPTPIPYPNDPDDPTKPKTPDYPTTPPQPGQPVPKVPVIPYVPGYTPKTPNGTPLVPIDPEHPEKGYKVPPVPETPNDPKLDTPIEYTPDGQRAIVKFVVIGEDGKETELETSRITVTGKTGEKIPTENFNDTLKKLTGDPVNNGDYELVDNPLKDGATFDTIKDQEGKEPSQVFVVKLRQINVIPPTPRIVERPSGNTVEVDVPSKDADTLSITFTKRNSTEKETIVTKKDKDGTWKIEKSPVGVTINPTNGRVYIPSEQVQPKTWVDTQTKHKYKQSKIVSVMPNILDVPKFEGTTEWIDVNGNVLRPTEDGFHEKGRIANHVWLESRLEGNKVTHIFFAGSPSVDKPEYKITVWFDKDGNPLKPDQPGTHEAGNIPGYRYITTVTIDGITIHKFEKIPPVLPNEPIPNRPEEPNPQPNPEHPSVPTPSPELPNQETPIPEPTPEPDTPRPETPVSPDPEVPTDETGKREELPNTGTEANAGLAGAGFLTLLAGLGLGFFKKKEDESE